MTLVILAPLIYLLLRIAGDRPDRGRPMTTKAQQWQNVAAGLKLRAEIAEQRVGTLEARLDEAGDVIERLQARAEAAEAKRDNAIWAARVNSDHYKQQIEDLEAERNRLWRAMTDGDRPDDWRGRQ